MNLHTSRIFPSAKQTYDDLIFLVKGIFSWEMCPCSSADLMKVFLCSYSDARAQSLH